MKSIRAKLLVLLLTSLVLLVGGASTYTVVLTRRAIVQTTNDYALETARENAQIVGNFLAAASESAVTMAGFMETIKNSGVLEEQLVIDLLVHLLGKHEDILTLWASFEPGGWKGLQEEGYFTPYIWREGSGFGSSNWMDQDAYNTELGEDYYAYPKKLGRPVVLEPYVDETEDGVFVLMTTIAVPLFDETGRFFGVFGADISLDVLGRLVNGISFLDTGYAALVSEAGKVIAHPDKDLVGTDMTDIEPPEGMEALSAVLSNGVAKQVTVFSPSVKKNVARIIVPVDISGTAQRWGLMIMVPKEELFAVTNRILYIIVLTGAVLLAVIIVILLLVTGRITKPLKDFNTAFTGLAGGDFTLAVNIRSGDELQFLGERFNDLTGRLRETMSGVIRAAGDLNNQGKELMNNIGSTSSSVLQIKNNTRDLQGKIAEQSGLITEMVSAVENIGKGTEVLNENVHNQVAAVAESSASIEEMVSNIKSVHESMEMLGRHFDGLLTASETGKEKMSNVKKQVGEVVSRSAGLMETNKLIAAIAAQTNMLSMNAAIEAAHAGEAGLGFSVVANEVRSLATTASARAKEIASELKSLKEIIDSVMKATADTEDSFSAIKKDIGDVNSLVLEVKNALAEQDAGSHQILEALTEMNDITGRVRTATENLNAEKETIKGATADLKSISVRVSGGIGEITAGTEDIGKAMDKVSEMGKLNQEKIAIVEKGIGQFRITG